MNRTNGWSCLACLLAATTLGLAWVNAGEPVGPSPEAEGQLLSALGSFKAHIEGKHTLDANQLEAHKAIIDKHRDLFGKTRAVIQAAFDLVRAYETVNGPLWVAHPGFRRVRRDGKLVPPANDIHWTIFQVMQHIMDRVYTAENLTRYADLLNGFRFQCASNFPGPCPQPADPDQTYTVPIYASYPDTWGWPTQGDGPGTFARKPTGTYLAPGSIATVTVPASLVGKGYKVRVGAHSWDFENRPNVLRLYRVSLVYDINSTETKVANPLGGGIYIEVPWLAAGGVVNVQIRNAVRAPFFSAKSFYRTSLDEWRNKERKHPAPWADFESDKYMCTVPRVWIYNLDDPVTLMNKWDLAMDTINDLMGFPRLRGKQTMYDVVDLQLRGSAFFPGWPTGNHRGSPIRDDCNGYASSCLVRGPEHAPDFEFHEQGHAYFFPKFKGETESTVNLLHVAVLHKGFGYDLDEAFRRSRSGYNRPFCTLDNTAVEWMTSLNFVNKQPMTAAEKAYQLKGHAKFVDIARLFGWDKLGQFWYSFTSEYEKTGKVPAREIPTDAGLLRLSKAVGVDIRPLFHFWGLPPQDAPALAAAMANAQLKPSAKICDTLMRYKALVPRDNQAFRDFARKWWGRQPSPQGHTTERDHAHYWDQYTDKTATLIQNTVQEIIDLYFPNGRPGA